MFKRFWATGLTVAMLIAQEPVNVYASEAVSVEAVQGTVETEEVAETETVESDAIVATEESVAIIHAKKNNVVFEVNEPDSNIISVTVSLPGITSWDEYNNLNTSYHLYISETEDFDEYMNYYLEMSEKAVDNGYEFIASESVYAKPNTQYYVKLLQYNYNTNESTSGDVIAVTTKDVAVAKATVKATNVGTASVELEATIEGFSKDLVSGSVSIQIAPNEAFSSKSMFFFGTGSNEETTTFARRIKATSLKPNMKYYVRIVVRDIDGKYIALSDVLEVTTRENEEYEDSMIPDEVLRAIIKDSVSSFDKASCEAVTYLSIQRKAGENEIKDLTGIELLPNLKTLKIYYHDIEDLSPVEKLTDLEYLTVQNSKLKTIPDLSGLIWLKSLKFYGNYIPASEFATDNTNIPNQFRNASWLTENKNSQRTSEEIGFVSADTYYKTAGAGYALQVEINNIYIPDEYTLSIYEGDVLWVEDKSADFGNGDYSFADWLCNDLITEEGTHTLTFVVKKNGEEIGRTTKAINFSSRNLYVSDKYTLFGAKETYLDFSAYLYNEGAIVQDAYYKDKDGNVAIKFDSVSKDTENLDARYENIFANNLINSSYQQVSANADLNKYLRSGKYDLVLELDNGEARVLENALTVTDEAFVESVYTTDLYISDSNGVELYLAVYGYNVDWSKVWPEVYDAEGNVLSEMVEYKVTGTSSAVYRLKNKAGVDWSASMTAKMQGEKLLNGEQEYSVSVDSSSNIAYAEYDWVAKQFKLVCNNIQEDVNYAWKLYDQYKGSVLATAKGSVRNGLAVLNMLAADGSRYDFEKSGYCSYCVQILSEEADIIGTFDIDMNNDNIYSSNSGYGTGVNGYSTQYVNNGTALSDGFSMDFSVLPKHTEDMTAVLLDINEEVIANGDVRVDVYDDYWYLGYNFTDPEVENDTAYYVEIKNGEESLGKIAVYVLDETKPYYSDGYINWDWNTKTAMLNMSGYWPETMESDKIQLTLTDQEGNEVVSADPVRKYRNDEYSEVDMYYDLSEDWDTLVNEYVSLYWKASYKGEEIDYFYFDQTPYNTVYMGNAQPDEGYFFRNRYELGDGKYTYPITGVETDSEKATTLTALIYLPYQTTPVKEFNVTVSNDKSYYFTKADLAGLKVNSLSAKYDIVLVDEDGRCVSVSLGDYLGTNEPQAESVKLNKTSLTLAKGNTYTLKATVVPAELNKDAVWSSTNEDIATVNQKGEVKAVGVGTATIIVTVAGRTVSCVVNTIAENPFADVPEYEWSFPYVKYAYEHGLMNGKGIAEDGKIILAPNDTITRAEFVQTLYSKEGKTPVEFENLFVDVKDSDWFDSAVIWANENNIVAGTKDGFKPNDPISREQMAGILLKYATYKGYDVTVDEAYKLTGFNDTDKISSWATNGLKWAIKNGVMSGKGDRIDPIGNATRAEAATMLKSFIENIE